MDQAQTDGAAAHPTGPVAGQPPVPVAGEPPVPVGGQPPVPVAGEPPVPVAGQPPGPVAGQPPVPVAGEPPVPVGGQPPVPKAGQPSSEESGRGTRQEGARLLGPADIRRIAARLGSRPTKRLGQNFVIDAGTIRRIVTLAGLQPADVVLEVGPGLGSLTLGLLGAARRVVAVEVDPILAAELPATVAGRAAGLAGRLDVVTADALSLQALPGEPPTALVANLPYNVAVPVLLHLLETMPSISRALVMVQAEVADRMCAPPGSRTYGVPSVKLAWYGTARRAGSVSRTVFWPVPNVDSALVEFTRWPEPGRIGEVEVAGRVSREAVFAVVDAAFAQRRKTLRSALAQWAGSPQAAEQVLREAGVDPSLRGEALGVAQYIRIAEAAGRASTIIES